MMGIRVRRAEIVRGTVAWLLVAVAGMAGGSCDSTPPPGSSGPVALEDYERAWAELYCEQAQRCGVPVMDDIYYVFAETGPGCVERVLEALRRGNEMRSLAAPYQAAVVRGTATWDADLAGACLDAQRALPCFMGLLGAMDEHYPECRRLAEGLVAPGGACRFDPECSAGWCDTSAGCPGVCVAYATAGGACDDSIRCPPDQDCASGACRPLEPEPFRRAGRGEACGDFLPCAFGLACAAGTSTCVNAPGDGAACLTDDSLPCALGHVCDDDGLCHRVFLAAAEGAACGNDIYTGCDPVADLQCDEATSRCVPMPGEGQACTARRECVAEFYCGTDGTCRRKATDGEPCSAVDSGDACRSGYCDQRAGVCAPLGDACFW